MPLKTIVLFFLLAFSNYIFAQKSDNRYQKWGQVSAQDLAMTSYALEPEAPAVVLHDVGTTRIDDSGREISVVHSRFRRFKIFKVEAFDQSLLSIYLRSGRSGELINGLQVQHITPDGRIEKVSTDNIFSDKVNEYWKVKKMFVPNLQAGSIVEYRYEVTSTDVFSLYDWFFHDELPVRWSEITTHVRPSFDYRLLIRAHKPFDVEEKGDGVDGSAWIRLGMADLYTMKKEPFMTSLDQYRTHVRFQLHTVTWPGRYTQKVMTTWENSARELEQRVDFGRQYDKGGNFNKAWAAFEARLAPGETPEAVAQKALDFVSEHVRWDGSYWLLSNKDLDDAFQRKNGSTAEINLLLVALLQKADLDAVPVLVSTRGHGVTYEEYPFIEQFNSVVALLRHNDKNILLDGSMPYLPLNQLALAHCNRRGWVVDHKKPNWIDLPTPELNLAWIGDAVLQADGSALGHMSLSSTGLYAADWREDLEQKSPAQFAKAFFGEHHPEMVCDSAQVEMPEGPNKPLKVNFRYQIPGQGTDGTELIYLSPIYDFFVSENPFKSPRRDFPVNFTGPTRASYVMSLTLPEGYVVEELPLGSRSALPDQGGNILFSCEKQDDRHLQILLKMSLARAEYGPEQYQTLRKYFDLVAEKVKFKLVLKKV